MIVARRVALVLAACGLFGCGGEERKAAPPPIRGNSLVLVDAKSGAVAADVPVAKDPTRLAYGDGAFWVVSPERRTVTRVDPEQQRAKQLTVGEHPYDVAVGGGAVWVPDHDGQRLLRLDVDTNEVRQTGPLGLPAISVGYGFGSAWVVVADGRLLRVDPASLRVMASIADVATTLEGTEPKLAIDAGAVWVSSPADSTIARVDPGSGKVDKRSLSEATGVSAGAGAVWVADNETSLWRLDGQTAKRIEVGLQPQDVAATDDGIWVTLYGDQSLVRVDDGGHVATTIRLPHHPIAVAAGDGFVAVAVLGAPL